MESIPVKCLTIDPALQHRKADSEVVAQYADLYRAGVKFPPVEVIFDGEEYYLWDGIQRLMAASSAGLTHINANVVKGNARMARWLSFGANAKHGVPRPQSSVRSILKQIYDDKEWCARTTQEQIANHVGVTRALVAKFWLEFNKPTATEEYDFEHEEPSNDSDAGSNTSDIVTRNNTGTPESDTTVSENDESGESDTSDRRKEGYDYIGTRLPECLTAEFNRIGEINKTIHAISIVAKSVKQMANGGDQLFAHFPATQFSVDIRNALSALRFAKPYAVCPYCHGNEKARGNCKACKRAGFMPKQVYDLIPAELK